MKLIVALGNVGDKYSFTRHNMGFMVADYWAVNEGFSFREESKLKCLFTKIKFNNEDIIIIKPTTYMNLSGEAVRAVMDYYKIDVKDILIVYDDIALDLGRLRFRANGSDGGHNGIKSVIQHLGTKNVARLKIGIGPQPNLPSEVFVLQNFSKEELDMLKVALSKAKEGIQCYFKEGMAAAQNKFN